MNQQQMLNPMFPQPKMMPPTYANRAQQSNFPNQMNTNYGVPNPGRSNWNWNNRSKGPGSGSGAINGVNELENHNHNRLKARRFYHKKKFNRMGPYAHAPRNTTSYLIRAKKEGGIASLISPCPVTPAVLPTPVFSPSREELVDMAKEEWGVDGYGSMKGLIRLRSSSPGHEVEMDDYEDEEEGDSGESDVEEHVEMERRLDHDLSRFEMIYPNVGLEYSNGLENRVCDQDTQLSQLEGENVLLKEKLCMMERELGEIKRRMQCLERQRLVVEEIHEIELVDNVSENSSEGTIDDGSVKNTEEDERKDKNSDHLEMQMNNKNGNHDQDLMSGCGEVDDGKDLIKNDMEDTAPGKESESVSSEQ